MAEGVPPVETIPHANERQESSPKRGGIFISYRRSDSAGYVGSITERLGKEFKRQKVFRDFESIAPGALFPTAIRDALDSSAVVLAIVGPSWLSEKGPDGEVRISKPEDYVRLEIVTALQQGLDVIPVLVGDARMPSANELPESLRQFADCQAIELSNSRRDYDLDRIVAAVRSRVDPGFRRRRVLWAVAVAAVLISGVFLAKYVINEHRIDQIRQTVEAGNADQKYLEGLDFKYASGYVDPRIHLYKAEAYQKLGNADLQLIEAELAANSAMGSENNFVAGRAKMLACDAKAKKNLSEAAADCEQALKFSAQAKDKVGQVRAMNTKANILYHRKDTAAALKAYQEVLAFAQANALLEDEYGALYNLGLALQDQGELQQARANFESAKDGFVKSGHFGEASNACNSLGTISLSEGNIEAARKAFEEARDLANKDKGDQSRLAQAYLNLGLLDEQAGRLIDGEGELKQALGIYKGLGRPGDVASANNALGDVYLQLGKYPEARDAYRQAASAADSDSHAWSVASLTDVEVRLEQVPSAESMNDLEAALQEAQQNSDSETESFARLVKARALLSMNKTDEARKQAEAALKLAEDGKQSDNANAAGIVLAEIEATKGSLEAAQANLSHLKQATYLTNVGQNLEVRLVYAKLMLKRGPAEQRIEAKASLQELLSEAQAKHYALIATKAQAMLEGKKAAFPPQT